MEPHIITIVREILQQDIDFYNEYVNQIRQEIALEKDAKNEELIKLYCRSELVVIALKQLEEVLFKDK